MAQKFPRDCELLASVAEFLKQDIQPIIDDPAVDYRLKVALNSLGIVGRQCESGADMEALEQSILSRLLDSDGSSDSLNAELAIALREERVDATNPKVVAAMKAIAMAKMAIDNPRYSTYLTLKDEAKMSPPSP